MKACELVGVSRRTIYNWIANGKVEYVRTAGGSIRIFADTLWRDAAPTPRSEESDARTAPGSGMWWTMLLDITAAKAHLLVTLEKHDEARRAAPKETEIDFGDVSREDFLKHHDPQRWVVEGSATQKP